VKLTYEPATALQRAVLAEIEAAGIETDITKRWETGVEHHPKAYALAKRIGAVDWLFGGDAFCWQFGGDGDNGEHLMYLLDILFETQDKLTIDK
jgi:hypothetical protein